MVYHYDFVRIMELYVLLLKNKHVFITLYVHAVYLLVLDLIWLNE